MIQSFLSFFYDCQHLATCAGHASGGRVALSLAGTGMDESIVSQVASSGLCPACHSDLTCQLCHDLCGCSIGFREQYYLAHRTWLSGLRAQSCRRCQIVLEALEKIGSTILDVNGTYSDGSIVIQPKLKGLVWISYKHNGRGRIAAEFQIHSPKDTMIRYSNNELS